MELGIGKSKNTEVRSSHCAEKTENTAEVFPRHWDQLASMKTEWDRFPLIAATDLRHGQPARDHLDDLWGYRRREHGKSRNGSQRFAVAGSGKESYKTKSVPKYNKISEKDRGKDGRKPCTVFPIASPRTRRKQGKKTTKSPPRMHKVCSAGLLMALNERPLKQPERSNKNNHLQSNLPVHPRGSHSAAFLVPVDPVTTFGVRALEETSPWKLTSPWSLTKSQVNTVVSRSKTKAPMVP
ncbi:hypothetical protein WN55_01566 [Dufourea novaeangliae]|uniref:Uncharacterized protein n=1 Tax=Dufourea novaeangliae TaxID=178035 RepID=A0A154PGE4_DUFNO|nr:hypothetical protein WN55_01566 [Dufourea novaeangliae]